MSGPSESNSDNVPQVPARDEISVAVKTAVCPQCGCEDGCVRVTPFAWSGGRHLNWYCPCCRHVWVRPDRRTADRVPEKPTFAPTGLMCPTCREPVASVKAVTARGVTFHCPVCSHDWDNRSTTNK